MYKTFVIPPHLLVLLHSCDIRCAFPLMPSADPCIVMAGSALIKAALHVDAGLHSCEVGHTGGCLHVEHAFAGL